MKGKKCPEKGLTSLGGKRQNDKAVKGKGDREISPGEAENIRALDKE